MIDVSKIRAALSGVDRALDGEPSNAEELPDPLHRIVWLPGQSRWEGTELDTPKVTSVSISVLRPLLELPPQGEAGFADALARVQPDGTVLGTSLGEVSADAIAEWRSFHDLRSQWGVYFSASKLLGYAQALFPTEDLSKSLPYVWTFVLHHELFHFAVEHAIAQLECLRRKAIYWPAGEMFVTLNEAEDIFYSPQEEALCNAYALRQMRGVRGGPRNGLAILRKKMADEGPGYRDGIKFESDTAFEAEFRSYLTLATDLSAMGDEDRAFDTRSWDGVDLLRLLPELPVPQTAVPIVIIDDHEEHELPPFTLGVHPFESLVGIEESLQFKKRLKKLDSSVQKQWLAQKRRLAKQTTTGFQLWERRPEGPVYSVRVGDNFRAHVLVIDPGSRSIALDIGSHKAMGHG